MKLKRTFEERRSEEEQRFNSYKGLVDSSKDLETLFNNLKESEFTDYKVYHDFEQCIEDIGNQKIIASRVDYAEVFTLWTNDHIVHISEGYGRSLDWEYRNPNV